MANKVENSSVATGSGAGGGTMLTQQQIEHLLTMLPSANSISNKLSSYDAEIDYKFAGIAYCSCAKLTSVAWILDTGQQIT